MMNLFGSKKGKSVKASKKSSRGSASFKDETPAQPNWPSLSPAPSMTTLGDYKEQPDGSPLLESRTSDLIPSFAPPLNLQARHPSHLHLAVQRLFLAHVPQVGVCDIKIKACKYRMHLPERSRPSPP